MSGRCTACRSASRTSSTPPTCRRERLADLQGAPSEADAACVTALRQAGAVIIGKTVTTEIASPSRADAQSARYGHTPGGSSSGRRRRSPTHGAAGARHADRRLGDPAGLVLRHLRAQTDVRADPAQRRADTVAYARHRRHLCPQPRGPGVPRRRAVGARPGDAGQSRAAAACCATATIEWPIKPMFAFVRTRWGTTDEVCETRSASSGDSSVPIEGAGMDPRWSEASPRADRADVEVATHYGPLLDRFPELISPRLAPDRRGSGDPRASLRTGTAGA